MEKREDLDKLCSVLSSTNEMLECLNITVSYMDNFNSKTAVLDMVEVAKNKINKALELLQKEI